MVGEGVLFDEAALTEDRQNTMDGDCGQVAALANLGQSQSGRPHGKELHHIQYAVDEVSQARIDTKWNSVPTYMWVPSESTGA